MLVILFGVSPVLVSVVVEESVLFDFLNFPSFSLSLVRVTRNSFL